MSELRKRLESARNAHHAARYPGDLAEQVLAPRLSVRKLIAQGGVLSAAVAAVVLMAIRMSHLPVDVEEETTAVAAFDGERNLALVFPALALPSVPERFASPPPPSFTLSAPSFPPPPTDPATNPTTKETT